MPTPLLPPTAQTSCDRLLAGHYTVDLILWLLDHGIMPVFTPLGSSYLNLTESVQRIVQRRALDGQYPKTPEEIIAWLEATARGWNREPTPFVWGGKRQARRQRAGGSAAYTRRPLHRRWAA
jgi:hypothetical protein